MSSHHLSVSQGTAMTIGAVLGTGVLSLPLLAARVAGPASLVAWVALIGISIALAITFAELGARHPDGGGVATFASRAFGPAAGAAVGWSFYLAIPLGAPAAAGFGSAYVTDVIGGGHEVTLAVSVAQIALVLAMNWFGIQVSGRLQLAIAGTLAVLLALAAAVSLPHLSLGNFTPFAPFGWPAVASAAALLVWAFAGWEAVASLSAEYADPARDVPRATAVALVTISILYLAVSVATIGVLGSGASNAPLSDLLEYGFGPAARPVTALVALLLSVGTMNAYIASASRLGAAIARDRLLPGWVGELHGERRIPRHSLVVVGALTLATLSLMWAGNLPTDSTLLLITGTFTLVYLIATGAALRLLERGSGPWWAALVALMAVIGLSISSGWHVIPALVVMACAVLLVRLGALGKASDSQQRAAPGPEAVAPGQGRATEPGLGAAE